MNGRQKRFSLRFSQIAQLTDSVSDNHYDICNVGRERPRSCSLFSQLWLGHRPSPLPHERGRSRLTLAEWAILGRGRPRNAVFAALSEFYVKKSA